MCNSQSDFPNWLLGLCVRANYDDKQINCECVCVCVWIYLLCVCGKQKKHTNIYGIFVSNFLLNYLVSNIIDVIRDKLEQSFWNSFRFKRLGILNSNRSGPNNDDGTCNFCMNRTLSQWTHPDVCMLRGFSFATLHI